VGRLKSFAKETIKCNNSKKVSLYQYKSS